MGLRSPTFEPDEMMFVGLRFAHSDLQDNDPLSFRNSITSSPRSSAQSASSAIQTIPRVPDAFSKKIGRIQISAHKSVDPSVTG